MKTKEEFNAYHKKYQLERYHKRRQEAIVRLGGKCVRCGLTEKLELDHIDRTQKSFDIAKLWAASKLVFEAELAKCQLLCRECHNRKTVVDDLGRKIAKGNHGTVSSYRYCHCEECKKAQQAYNKKYIEAYKERQRSSKSG